MVVCFICVAVLFVFMFSLKPAGSNGGHIDYYAHLGGFVTGVLGGLVFPKSLENTDYERNLRIGGGVGLVLYFGICAISLWNSS